MADATSDEEIVKKILQGEKPLYEILIHRYNQRLYRICRAILKNDVEARDVVQYTFAKGYEHLSQFEGRAKFSTWLTAIAIHEASLRRQRGRRFDSLDRHSTNDTVAGPSLSPEEQFTIMETRQILESMIDALPEKYRVVQVMRDVEGMSVSEAAECLGISPENVKVRLHRARALLRKRLYELFGSKVSDVFRFHLLRCDRIVSGASKRIQVAVIGEFARGARSSDVMCFPQHNSSNQGDSVSVRFSFAKRGILSAMAMLRQLTR